ncbi:MAG TPA: hypothetical protein VFG54_14135 [Prolixibacteraceae bacterium]|nr:hypothetical protein [Prolixibacteraceae bacterium]
MIKNYVIVLMSIVLWASCRSGVGNYEKVDRSPSIFPDYTDILIPPNIAPLNFMVNEPGSEYEVRIYLEKEKPIIVRSDEGSVQIPVRKWHSLLKKGKGNKLFMDVFVKTAGGSWQKYQSITNEIANEPIDSHLAYRLINTGYVLWNKLGIYQRNLENFDEKPILENKSIEYGCVNCHSFANNDPDKMMIHVRAIHGGTVINQDGKLTKLDTKSKYTVSAGAYPCWHPNGKHIAYSVNNIGQFFCTGEVRIEVADQVSDLIVLDTEKNVITTSAKVSTPNRENLPIWSPDGKYLYYISAAPAVDFADRIMAKYDMLRIAFDPATNQWGEVDTVLTSEKLGKSISFPKISPNGKYMMFCTSDNGYFTIHHPVSDLMLLNLETNQLQDMDINSPQTDSYHSFSSDGRWFVFSSKRLDGLFTRPFFSYLDENGKASKPFVMPQEDPEFYHTFIKNYNIPELITGEVSVSPLELRDKIMEEAMPVTLDPSVDTTYMGRHVRESK